jgi:hypothetical protein
VGANDMMTAAWNWRRPRNTWGLQAWFTRNQSGSHTVSGLTGWQATAGITKRLGSDFFMTLNYSHVSSRGTYLTFVNHVDMDGARITLGWAPHRRRSGPAEPQPEEESK